MRSQTRLHIVLLIALVVLSCFAQEGELYNGIIKVRPNSTNSDQTGDGKGVIQLQPNFLTTPNLRLLLTRSGFDDLMGFLQVESTRIPPPNIPNTFSGTESFGIGAIKYKIYDLQIPKMNLGQFSYSLSPGVITLSTTGMSFDFSTRYKWRAKRLGFPRGHGTAEVKARNGVFSLAMTMDDSKAPKSLNIKIIKFEADFGKYDIKLHSTFGFLFDLFEMLFKGVIKSTLNQALQKTLESLLQQSFQGLLKELPHYVSIDEYNLDLEFDYLKPIIRQSDVSLGIGVSLIPLLPPRSERDCPFIPRSTLPNRYNFPQVHQVQMLVDQTAATCLARTFYVNNMANVFIEQIDPTVQKIMFKDVTIGMNISLAETPTILFSGLSNHITSYAKVAVDLVSNHTHNSTLRLESHMNFAVGLDVKTNDETSSLFIDLDLQEFAVDTVGNYHDPITGEAKRTPLWFNKNLINVALTSAKGIIQSTIDKFLKKGLPLPVPSFTRLDTAKITIEDDFVVIGANFSQNAYSGLVKTE
jgi:hypothetical protein